MRILSILFLMVIFTAVSAFIATHSHNNSRFPGPGDSLEADRMKYMNEVMASIKGKEKMPANAVFKNLKVINGISAEHLLWMMNWGWSAELGVSCSHCHVIGNWESDSLRTKEITRGMWNMRVKIDSEIIPAITGKDYGKNPPVSCITCHRGKPVPDAK